MVTSSLSFTLKAGLTGLVFYLLSPISAKAYQQNVADTALQKQYLTELQTVGRTFSRPLRQHYVEIYSMPEQAFLAKMDSARALLTGVLNSYRTRLDAPFTQEQDLEINYYIDKLLVDYPDNYATYTGKDYPYNGAVAQRLKHNLPDFNKPALLSSSDFTDYARSFFALQVNHELQKPLYKNTDNQELQAIWKIIPVYVTNKKCREFWQNDYLYNHIDNKGIKNIATLYQNFISTCTDTAYLRKIKALYNDDYAGRRGHLIKTYKTAGPYKLDIHLFLPQTPANGKKRTVIVYFHGGSWSEGKPDWFFKACKSDAKHGWVACAVEYRIYGRERTLPFDAVKDARSAIRWLRQHAAEYHIDPDRIVATGNSAGGHLTLACAMADRWNEKTDDLHYSPVPNVLMVNSGVYDLTDRNTAWIRKTLKNKDLVKEISPDFLVKKGMPPTLVIHGTNDGNVPYPSAKLFEEEMTRAGNPLEFHSLEGASHFIWLDRRYSGKVDSIQNAFLKKSGY